MTDRYGADCRKCGGLHPTDDHDILAADVAAANAEVDPHAGKVDRATARIMADIEAEGAARRAAHEAGVCAFCGFPVGPPDPRPVVGRDGRPILTLLRGGLAD